MTMRAKYLRIPPDKWTRYQTKERPSGWKPPWLKLHASILDDHVLRRLAPEDRWVYIGILCLANETDNRVDSCAKSLSFRLTTSQRVVRKAVKSLAQNGLIEPCPARLVDKVAKTVRNDVVPKKLEVERKDKAVHTDSHSVAETALANITKNLRGVV